MKSKLRWVAIVIFGLLVVMILGWRVYTYSQSEAIYAAIIRSLSKPEGGPDAPPPISIFFVEINRQDPPTDFYKTYENDSFVVRPASQGTEIPATIRERPELDWIDSKTGEKGMRLNFRGIVWRGLTPTVFTSSTIYVMKREYGEWQVDYRAIMGF